MRGTNTVNGNSVILSEDGELDKDIFFYTKWLESYAFEHCMICATQIICFTAQLAMGLCPTSDVWKVIVCEK